MKQWQVCLGVICVLLFCVLPQATGQAQERKDEWKKAGYSFATLKSVFVETEFAEGVVADDLERRILQDKVETTFSRNLDYAKSNLSFLTEKELVKRLSASYGEDVAALAKTDPERYKKFITDGKTLYCQGILKVNFTRYEDTVRHIPAHIETYQTTQKVYSSKVITDSTGKQITIEEWIDVPVTEYRNVEAYDEITAHVAMDVSLVEIPTDEVLWEMLDSRDAVDKDKQGMSARILSRIGDRFKNIKKNG